jgi:hypothetical protein
MKFIDLEQKKAKYNGKDYINADSIEYNGETIYHFVADNDDLYCYLRTNDVGYRTNLVPISDETVLQNVISIFTPATMTAQVSNIAKDESMRAYQDNTNGDTNIKYFNEKAISDEKEDAILQFASDSFNTLLAKGYKFNVEKMLSKIKATKFTEATIDNDALGFFIEEDREVVLDRNLLDDLQDETKKRFLLRQICFAVAGNDYTSKIFSNDNRIYSVVDGKINKICEDAFAKENSTSDKTLKNLSDVEEGKIEYGFSEFVQNPEAMSIIAQMEYLTGMKAGNDIFDSKNNLDTAFINMYGKDLYNYLAARMNRLTSESRDITIADYTKLEGKSYGEYFEETQDIFLYMAFNKELEGVIKPDKKVDLTKATEFFERLKEFKKFRGQVVSFERDQERQERSYDTYFSLSLGRICRELAKESQQDMEQLYGQFHYEFEEPQDIGTINDQFKSLITDDITQTEIDEISRTLNRDAKNNSKVVIENERA